MAAALAVSSCSADEPAIERTTSVSIRDEVVASISDRFLAFAVDSAQVVGGEFWNPDVQLPGDTGVHEVPPYDFQRTRLRALTAQLAPGIFRVGGTDADRLYYDFGDSPIATPPEGYQWVMTRAQFDEIAAFASDLGFELFFTINAGLGPRDADGAWTSEQARVLLEYTRDEEVPVAVWELGNEPNGYQLLLGFTVSAQQFAEDTQRARELIDEVTPEVALAAPSVAYWPVAGDFGGSMEEFLAAGVGSAVDVVTWHYYPQQSRRCPVTTRRAEPDTMLVPENLDEVDLWMDEVEALAGQHAPGAEIWLGETGNAQCGGQPGVSERFASSIWYLDQLAKVALRSEGAMIRQTLSGSNYGLIDEETLEPTPDYFTAVLWQRLVGHEVLPVVSGDPQIRMYAHCTDPEAEGYADGAVTLIYVNLSDERTQVQLPAELGEELVNYQLTAESLESETVALNGRELVVPDSNQLPSLEGKRSRGAKLVLEPHGIGFAVMPAAGFTSCSGE